MPAFRNRSVWQRAALWLALAGVLLRSLIPIGFMPGWIGAVPGTPSWLVICPASELSRLAALSTTASDPSPGDHDASVHSAHAAHMSHAGMAPMSAAEHAAMLAAMTTAPTSPEEATDRGHADHHAQHPVDAPAQPASDHPHHAGADHEGHDPARHHGHVIAAEHQSCPFAGAAAASVPITLAALELPPCPPRLQIADARAATATRVAHRLPPPRGPPLHTVVQQHPTTHRARA